MKFCPNCGKRFRDSYQFCGSCGTNLKQLENENDFNEGLSLAGKAAKDAVENAFNEENREKVKAVANEAMNAIKNTDIEKGKEMASEGIEKIKKSKYGTIAIIATIIIAVCIFFVYGNSDERQVNKIAKTYAEFILEGEKSGTVSNGDIKKIVEQTEPELQKEFDAVLKREKEQQDRKLEKIKSNKEMKKKYEEAVAELDDASYKISEIKLTGDRGYAIISFDNFPRKEMQVFVVRKNDGKWYSGYTYFDDDVRREGTFQKKSVYTP